MTNATADGVEDETRTRTQPPTTTNDSLRAVDSDVRLGTNARMYHLRYQLKCHLSRIFQNDGVPVMSRH